MPTSPKSEHERKRRVVARGTLQGMKTAAIAQQAGCGPRHVRTLRAEEATQVLISDLLRPYREDLRRLIPKAIRAVECALVAQKTTRSDCAARLRAVRRLQDLLLLAQGAVELAPAAGAGPVAYAQCALKYREKSPKSEPERKRRVVARGTLQGRKTAAIAQEAGCGERHVRTLQAEGATQVLIRDLLRPYRENLRRLIPKVMRTVDRGLQAQKTTRSDFAAQLLAVRRAQDLLLQHEDR